VNPRAVFERLFGPGDEDPATRAMYRKYNTSILDAVMEDTRSLDLPTAAREMELRLVKAERDNQELVPTIDKPDSARIATFMVAREGSGRTCREIDVPESHHPLTRTIPR
jgi:hypothetical protein